MDLFGERSARIVASAHAITAGLLHPAGLRREAVDGSGEGERQIQHGHPPGCQETLVGVERAQDGGAEESDIGFSSGKRPGDFILQPHPLPASGLLGLLRDRFDPGLEAVNRPVDLAIGVDETCEASVHASQRLDAFCGLGKLVASSWATWLMDAESFRKASCPAGGPHH